MSPRLALSFLLGRRPPSATALWVRRKSTYKFVVVGGGTGGCAMANKLARQHGANRVLVVEPSGTHYYQPMFTLVGAGIKDLEDTHREMGKLLPKGVTWLHDSVVALDPDKSTVTTASGQEVGYENLILAMGIQLNYGKIPGLLEALKKDPMVVSNYSPKYVEKTFAAIKKFEGGEALFTFPNTPVKCAGAPQKIMYLFDDLIRRNGKRDRASITYCTSLAVIFGVKKYAEALLKVVADRDIHVKYQHTLAEIDHSKKQALFELKDKDGTTKKAQMKYDFIHVTPPMSTQDVLRTEARLVDAAGWLNVDRDTLQHKTYPNVFGIGDCTNLPTSKTAAAVAAQCEILENTINTVLAGGKPSLKYDGYTSCPLITKDGACILAEFDYDGRPLETFPFNQAKERRTMYHLKKDVMPFIYWNMLVSGRWSGPKFARTVFHLGRSQ